VIGKTIGLQTMGLTAQVSHLKEISRQMGELLFSLVNRFVSIFRDQESPHNAQVV
jgi:hypothetical protein